MSSTTAERLREAFDREDPAQLASLLASDVRWGGEEDSEDTCHTRDDVLAWYRQLQDRGVRARVTEMLDAGGCVILGLSLQSGAAGPRGPLPPRVFQVFRVVDGLVVDIRGFPERDQALAFAGATGR
jgi:hypothetical protein